MPDRGRPPLRKGSMPLPQIIRHNRETGQQERVAADDPSLADPARASKRQEALASCDLAEAQAIEALAHSGKPPARIRAELPIEELSPEHAADARQAMERAQRLFDDRQRVMAAAAKDFYDGSLRGVKDPVRQALRAERELPAEKKPQDERNLPLEVKLGYLASWEGETPFRHEYSLLGGRMMIRMATSTAACEERIYKHLQRQRKVGLITTTDDMNDCYLTLRTVLALEHVELGGKAVDVKAIVQRLQATSEDFIQVLEKTREELTREAGEGGILRSAASWRAAANCYRDFESLTHYLEGKLADPSFWPAIEG